MKPEDLARQNIDKLLAASGWHICGVADANIHAADGVEAQDQILIITKAVAQLKVNLANFSLIALPLPPLAEQIRIVAEVDRHLSIISEVESEVDANLQRVQALRQATLSSAFSGR